MSGLCYLSVAVCQTPDRERYALVGHIVGVLDCVASLAVSPVTTFRLHDRSIVIKHVEHYVLVRCRVLPCSFHFEVLVLS